MYNPCTRSNVRKIGSASGTTWLVYPNEKPSDSESSDWEVIYTLLTTDPSVQIKELWLTLTQRYYGDYLVRVDLADTFIPVKPLMTAKCSGPPLIFLFRDLQYLHIHVAFASRFADQPLKEIRFDAESKPSQAASALARHCFLTC